MKLRPRDDGCIKCDSTVKLDCPACPSGETCQFSVPTNCRQCPKSYCQTDDSSSSNNGNSGSGNGGKGSGGPSAGPIAGGVIGGIAAIAIITYLIWRFCIKPKRSSNPHHSVYETEAIPARHVEKDDAASRITRRSSTHTVHSIASTVLTRASNIIQIAYIPGVTNRATPTSPTVLVPPVPPIPIQHTDGNRERDQGDQHFFVPGNLRDSTYSGISSFSDRTSYAPRSSIASTIYGKQAQVQTPAQTGMRAKPTVVSVKSAGGSSGNTPPVPAIDFQKFGNINRPESSMSNFSVGSTYLNNANTATQGRAQVVKLGSGLKKIDIPKADASLSSMSISSGSSQDSANIPIITESPGSDQGPFSDPPERSRAVISTPTLGAVTEEHDERRSLKGDRPASGGRARSPFSDAHATRD